MQLPKWQCQPDLEVFNEEGTSCQSSG